MTALINTPNNMTLFGSSDFVIWETINTFSKIEIHPNTLVLCDIDDTLLHHPLLNHDWVSLIKTFFCLRHVPILNRTPEKESDKYFDEVLKSRQMQHTDRDGFFAMYDKCAGFAFVTARQLCSKDYTYDNLRSIGIEPGNHIPVYFTGFENKGEYIKQYINLSKYDHVIFIDDQPRNLENVFAAIEHPGLKLYQFKYEIEMSPYDYYPLPVGFNVNLRFDGKFIRDISDEKYRKKDEKKEDEFVIDD